ncbi:Mpp10 protein-domain-containing protein [Absidia repens]|uniref:Mpp10 protein-domain-containing protein n=1 Tax=Absidia repens TaxID=90262 RepID=A0A1X2HXW7_9FUNG|nr:Mpp10 protein-domain-containing protein [Absidia repens]
MNAKELSNSAPSTPLTTQGNNTQPGTSSGHSNNTGIFSNRQRTIPRLRSNISAVDSKFIELTRCLYQAKTIVQDLTSFHASVLPTLSLSTYHDPTHSPQQRIGSVAFLQHIKQYLDDNFTKFTKLCKILMMILSRLEQNAQVKQERVQSFRNEIMEEWRIASDIKRRIQTYLQQNNTLFDGTSSGTAAPSTSMRDQLQSSPISSTPHCSSFHFPVSNHTSDQQRFQQQQQQQQQQRSSPLTSPSSKPFDPISRHTLHSTSTTESSISAFQVADMASGSILESRTCSESPSAGQIGSPASTISGNMVAKLKTSTSLTSDYIKSVVDKPQVFFSTDQKLVDQSISLTKHLYDSAKQHEEQDFSPFTELLTEGFDQDQIWEELVTQNEPFLQYCKTSLKHWSKPSTWTTTTNTTLDDEDSHLDQDMNLDTDDNVESDDMDLDNGFDSLEVDQQQDSDSELEEEEYDEPISDAEAEELEEEEDEADDIMDSSVSGPAKRSEVDDDFFNLDEFNKWTEQQEALDMESDREDDDDEIDFDNDLDAMDGDDDDDEDGDDEHAQDITFKDFFMAPAKPRQSNRKQVNFASNLGDDDDDDEEEDMDQQEEDSNDNEEDGETPTKVRGLFDEDDEEEKDQKSAHERQQDRLRAQIEQFEQENIEGRHWTLKGEASVKSRPVNSLLEEDMEFDHSVKPVPVITQETTNVLEDMIKKRISEGTYDDVERKADPSARPWLPSKRVELVDTQSKKSLADLYEEEYVKKSTGDQSQAKDEALEKEHEAIRGMFSGLCEKLDALSNFHFTPKAAKAELSVVSNAASISMEEIIPVNVSDATLLAPEEVYDKKHGDIKDQSEMDQDERRRVRKQKKTMKRKENAVKEKERELLAKSRPASASGFVDRQSKTKAVKELIGQKNVTVIGKDGKKMKQDKTVTSASLF